WHTRILGPSPSGYSRVHPFASLPISAAETEFANNTPLRNKTGEIARFGRDNPSTHVEVDKLILTTCGAWFSGSVNYPRLEWTHPTAMGRDFYVRLLVRGVLFPFGHGASVVLVYERRFDTAAKVAGLQQQVALIITQPALRYGIESPDERE